MRPVELKQVLKLRADLKLEKRALDCTPGRHSGESRSSLKRARGMFVFFNQKDQKGSI